MRLHKKWQAQRNLRRAAAAEWSLGKFSESARSRATQDESKCGGGASRSHRKSESDYEPEVQRIAELTWAQLYTKAMQKIGRVTGMGIAGNIRRHYSTWVLYPVVALLLAANIFNLGADIEAMGSALRMLVGGPALIYAVGFGITSVVAAVFIPYREYAQVLKWATLVLLVYVAAAL
jgi:Natural resistance-associated macrophage protein